MEKNVKIVKISGSIVKSKAHKKHSIFHYLKRHKQKFRGPVLGTSNF